MIERKMIVMRFGIAVVFLLFCLLMAEDLGAWIRIH